MTKNEKPSDDRKKFDRYLDAIVLACSKARLKKTRGKSFSLSMEEKVAISALAWIAEGFAKTFGVPFELDEEE